MAEIVSTVLPFSLDFLVTSFFSILWAGLVFTVIWLVIAIGGDKFKALYQWRSFWLCALVAAGSPFVFAQLSDQLTLGIVPDLNFELPTVYEAASIPPENRVLHEYVSTSLSAIELLAIFWLLLYVCGVSFKLAKMVLSQLLCGRRLSLIANNQLSTVNFGRFFTLSQSDYLVKSKTQVFITQSAVTPFVMQLFSRKLVLPSYVLSMDATERHLIVEHEIMHLKRLDPLLIFLVHIFTCILWFNPFLGWMKSRFSWAIELGCDRDVLKSCQRNLHRVYAQTMIDSLRRNSLQRTSDWAVAFSFFAGSNQVPFFRRRLINIMEISRIESFSSNLEVYMRAMLFCGFSTILILAGLLLKPGLTMASAEVANLTIPVESARISSPFGDLSKIRKKPHEGTDFAAPIGTPVVSAASGVVIVSTDEYKHKNYGKIIIVDHGDDTKTLYSHLNEREVEVGQSVRAGQPIGTVGVSGRVTGPHLHFELIKDGKRINPATLLAK
ncbi:M23/M56 family metallopeptidase [Microbulbifer sp. SSSA002]|uniref:M23/M56 family metallopeptidase n=1 Tax=unclassified Microbulbifer TaxID=2619833 RepID=UPI00403A2A65